MAFSKRSITVVHNSSIEPTWEIVIYLDFHKTKQALWLVDSWSLALGTIQVYPDRDIIA